MLMLTNLNTQGSLTSVTMPPRSYLEKAEVSPMLKENRPGDGGDTQIVGRRYILITAIKFDWDAPWKG